MNLGVAETAGTSGPLGEAARSGSIILNGGYLQYSAVNQYDYSGRFSTAANQAYNVDTNGQNVTWATALTSSGGSLTKVGAGTLMLTASNTYTGATTISAGTLQLGDGVANNGSVAGNITDSAALSFANFSCANLYRDHHRQRQPDHAWHRHAHARQLHPFL